MEQNKKHGGKRNGAGAKPKYKEPTETISFRCPKSKVNEMRGIVKAKLDEYLLQVTK
jgi:hypothetical protein